MRAHAPFACLARDAWRVARAAVRLAALALRGGCLLGRALAQAPSSRGRVFHVKHSPTLASQALHPEALLVVIGANKEPAKLGGEFAASGGNHARVLYNRAE